MRRTEQETRIHLREGPTLSPDALGVMGRLFLTPTPTMDWAWGRLLVMLATTIFLVGAVTGIVRLVRTELNDHVVNGGLVTEQTDGESEGEAVTARRTVSSGGLRNDLFQVPAPARPKPQQEPRTNPVELLRLIELQGVIGGATPRAMVLYKRTNETITVSVGDDLGEFKVMEIRDRRIVLKWREELFELSL